MPRKPSTSPGLSSITSPNPSSILVHKTTESHAFGSSISQQYSLQTLGSSATPQQKIVQVLVNRLKHKLPCNSGLSLDRVESDTPTQRAIETLVELSIDSLDMIAWALSELLDRLAKQIDPHTGHVTIEVLQSQLLILKVLSVTMASRWTRFPSPSDPSTIDDRSSQQAPSVISSWEEPPPLDDSCIKYILSVMVLFMRQTANSDVPLMVATRSTDTTFRDFEDTVNIGIAAKSIPPPPISFSMKASLRNRPSASSVSSGKMSIRSTSHIQAVNTEYEKTHMSLVNSSLAVNDLIAKYVGRIIFHISASNWRVVFERLSTKISNIATHPEHNTDSIDLQLMSHSVLDRARLVVLLNQLSSLLVNMRIESQRAIAVHLRSAIWNWIDVFPTEFNEAIRMKGKTEGAPERVFDLLYSVVLAGNERVFWPTLTVLNCISSDRISADFQYGNPTYPNKGRKELRFSENTLRHLRNHSKFSEVALACAVDMCRAAAYIDPEGDVPLRLVASDIAHEIKSALYSWGSARKPFWESHEDIDVALYGDALVAVYRFLPLEDSGPLFQVCFEPERSEPVKTCVVRACLTLAQDAPRFHWQKPLDQPATWVATRGRDILTGAGLRRLEIDPMGVTRRVAARPKAKRIFPEPLSEREVLILAILSLWRLAPLFFQQGIQTVNDIDNWVNIAVKIWEAPIDISVKISTASTMRKVSEQTFMTPPTAPNYMIMVNIVKSSLPVTLLSVVGNLLTTRTDIEAQSLWMSIAQQVLEVYVTTTDLAHVKYVQVDPGRTPAFVLTEISFLVALASADNTISQLAGKGLRLICHAEHQPDAPPNPIITDEDRSQRNPIYEQLGDPRVAVVGRVVHQKRIRKLIRTLSFSAGIHVVVWEECYWRWRALNESIINMIAEGTTLVDGADSSPSHSLSQQEARFQWQNLTLFLAVLSGSCVQEKQDLSMLAEVIPAKFLPDRMRVIRSPLPLVEDFVSSLINLVATRDIHIRDVVREALGSELSPRLYGKLIRNLESTVTLLDDESESQQIDTCTVLLEQIIDIFKLITENTEVALEDVMSVDMSLSMEMLATFIARFSGPSTHRIKTKYCVLCESVCSRTDTLTIRKDSPTRYIILDILLQWMSPRVPGTPQSTVLNDLNMACLRAIVKLLDRLQLRLPDTSNTGDDAAHYVSRLFNKYSTALLMSLETCQLEVTPENSSELGSIEQKLRVSQKESELRELVITGLAHLVTANSESGFKQCLPLAYGRDARNRVIFALVFARVIGQGTVFDSEETLLTKARHTSLCELVRGSDMVLAITICEVCPPAEVELMISVLLNVFNSRESLLNLIKLMIEREVAQTDHEASLFRSSSTCSRLLTAFARLHGYSYLRNLVQPLLDTMIAMPPGTGYEVDPSKAMGQDILENQRNVEYVASTFLGLISSSLPALPGMFREICAHIAKVVTEVWPDSKYAAMGAFIFLRFISPAVVSPNTIDIELPKENYQVLRRGLMVIAKIIQNLANNIFFGKEAHMTILNKFLESNIANITRFLSEMHKFSATNEDNNDQWIGITSDDTDVVVLHRFLHKHADKLGKELLSLSKQSPEDESSAVPGKRAWDGLCALLVDLGPPMEVPRLSNLTSDEHREYSDLMARHANRNTASVEGLFIETDIRDDDAVFVLLFSTIDVANLDIELFMYYIFKTLQSDTYRSQNFDIILDCTSFTSKSEVPLQWLKYCAEVIPADILVRFSTTRILNPNTLAQKYLRRLYNVSAGTPLCSAIKAYSSVHQLLDDVATAALPSLAFAMSLEQGNQETFTDVTMKNSMRVPVALKVGSGHIRVTSVKSLPISPGLSCQSTDLIPLTDVSDVYNVSTGQELYEFIIRRRQGVTVYFSSPSRDTIVKTIRSAKGRLKGVQAPLTERFSRFSNVPATLLHIGLLSVDLNDEELRGAAYDLLGAVCNYLKYDKSPIVTSKAGFISGDPIAFVVNLSENLAEFAPQLTLDFIHEVSAAMSSMDKASTSNRLSCLQYMSPWIRNLSHFANAAHPLYERSGARLRDCIRTLSDLSVAYPEITAIIQKCIWAEVAKLDSNIVDIILDELVRTATDGGVGTRRCETISHIVAALSSINVRGRIYSKLRKALSKVSAKPSNTLPEHQNWNEISTLIRLALVVGSQSTHSGQCYLYVPEIIHLVLLVAGDGPSLVRKSVYGIIMNLLQSLYISRPDDRIEPELMRLINDCTLPENLELFGLRRETPTAEYSNIEFNSEKASLDAQEELTRLLLRIMTVTAGSPGLLNVWKARWMSLVTATAFQQSPAVQTRSFIALATITVSQVDDDFFYQILVAFRSALTRANESHTAPITSILRCICKILPVIIGTSRYICVLFWLAVALLQGSHASYYAEALSLLQVTLKNMEEQGLFQNNSVQSVLLEAREPLEEVTSQLDGMLRLSFDASFSFSLAAIIFKGMRYSALKESAEAALRTLLQVTMAAHDPDIALSNGPADLITHDALGYFIALLTVSTKPKTFHRLLKESRLDSSHGIAIGISDEEDDDGCAPRVTAEFLCIRDSTTASLVASFVGSILSTAQGDDAETEILYGLLSSLCFSYPDTVSMTCERTQDRIKDIFANSSNPSIIRSVSNIFRVALQDTSSLRCDSPIPAHESTSTLSTVDENSVSSHTHSSALDELGMQGLADSFQFLPPNRGHATKLLQWIPTLVTLMIS
ncbi:hypothetical protein BYT27DRAFT_7141632 [Phlegmacium glaucopus]|nr:hypothetical protein BYT27DRAFT_7141632 [Phlegmacium glaucopus]